MTEIKRASIKDIADELKISVSTVSRALQGNTRISQETIDKVQALAKKWNYKPNVAAKKLQGGRSNTIGVVVPIIGRNFFSSAIEGIEETAHDAGYDVLICQTHESYDLEKKVLSSFERGKVDGVIVSVASETTDYSHFKLLKNDGLPLVMFDRIVENVGDGMVSVDDFRGAYELTNHLISQGYKKIYHYTSNPNVSVWRNRCEGYQTAMKEAGLVVGKEWIYEGGIRKEDGEKYARILIEKGDIPEAIFCTSDYVALGVMLEFKEFGLRIPENIAVAGFANEAFGSLITPSLTSVDQSSKKMGKTAAQTLIKILQGEKVENVVLNPKLIIRESTIKKSK